MVLLRRAFVVAAIAWAIALPLAAWIASRPHTTPVLSAMTIAIYGIGGIVCHQLSERSFHLWAAQLPVCARCTGIYAGAAVCAGIALMGVAHDVIGGLVGGQDDGMSGTVVEAGNLTDCLDERASER